MKKIEKEMKVTKFVSFDGIEFDTDYECHNYESSKFGELLKEIEGCIVKRVNSLGIFANTSDEPFYQLCEPYSQYYVMVPRTRHDVSVLNRILDIAGNTKETVTGDDCFNMIILAANICCNTLGTSHIIRLADIVKDLTNGQFEVISNIKDTAKDSAKPVKDIAEK
jgi:hypothetical protein